MFDFPRKAITYLFGVSIIRGFCLIEAECGRRFGRDVYNFTVDGCCKRPKFQLAVIESGKCLEYI